MKLKNEKKISSFFFLIVDDGGFYRTWPEGKGELIDFSAYLNLVRLSKYFNIQIVLACTTKFFDIHGVSESPQVHKDTARIINLLETHSERIIVADHGYDHLFGNNYCEFYDYKCKNSRPVIDQEKHIDQSISIYRSLGWPIPQIFVPPAHGWEPGVTDRLYGERGIKYLTSYLWLKQPIVKLANILPNNWKSIFKPKFEYPKVSQYLEVLPRLGLGIAAHYTNISTLGWWKAYHSIVPMNLMLSILLHRRSVNQPHNYTAHIANFSGEENYRQWYKFLENVANKKARLVKTFDESLQLWHSHN